MPPSAYQDPGLRRTPVVLERLVTTPRDAHGNVSETWATVLAQLWVELLPLTGRELLQADAAEARVTSRLRFPYRLDVTVAPTMRFRTLSGRARVLNILAVRDLEERHELLEVDVEEVDGAAP